MCRNGLVKGSDLGFRISSLDMKQANYDLFTFNSKFACIPGPIWRTSFFFTLV